MTDTMIVEENVLVLSPGIIPINPVTDVIISAGLPVVVNSPIIMVTGYITGGTTLDKAKVIEIQVEYESNLGQTLIFEYSKNGGASWNAFATKTIGVTNKPEILSVVNSITGHGLQFRLRSVTIGILRVLAFIPRVVQEARVFP